MIFKIAGTSDSMIDGKGISYNVFFQGCKMNCKGCQNPTLQDHEGGYYYDTTDIINHLNSYRTFYNSLVFLGGEPMEQPEALLDLASRSRMYNVLYTGWLYEDIPDKIRNIFNMIVDGPYIESLKNEPGAFPASKNQRIIYKENGD